MFMAQQILAIYETGNSINNGAGLILNLNYNHNTPEMDNDLTEPFRVCFSRTKIKKKKRKIGPALIFPKSN